ncbi:MAG: TetR/AcrR family transcriptional regulator [Gemmatimonadales bacterium]|nr:TetR/AcrR family transcriptional regulator [Gemmatimonadales bacterium]
MPRALPLRRPPREAVVASILDAAVTLFAERGYEATTMQDVAARVGMTAPALYYYFDSKQALLFEVIESNLVRILARVEQAAPVPTTATEDLATFVRDHVRFQLESVAGARIYNAMFLGTSALFAALTPSQRSKVTALQHRFRGRLDAILGRGVATGEFRIEDRTVTAMGLIALGEFAPAWFRASGPLSAEVVADQYAALAVRMVARVGGTDRRPR